MLFNLLHKHTLIMTVWLGSKSSLQRSDNLAQFRLFPVAAIEPKRVLLFAVSAVNPALLLETLLRLPRSMMPSLMLLRMMFLGGESRGSDGQFGADVLRNLRTTTRRRTAVKKHGK